MTPPAASVFEHTVHTLAAAHGLDVQVSKKRLPGHGAHVVVRRRRAVVSVSTGMTRENPAVQQFAAAHEVAHVVLRHRLWHRGWPAGLWALSMSAAQMIALAHALTVQNRNLALALVLVVGGLVPLLTCVGTWVLLAWRTRRCESAADRVALTWGYTLAGSEDALNRGENRLTTSRFYRPFRMHPLPTHRAAAGGPQGSAAKENDHDQPNPP